MGFNKASHTNILAFFEGFVGKKLFTSISLNICPWGISITYSVPANFRRELIEPSAREVEGKQFLSSDVVSSNDRFEPCSLLLSKSKK